MDFIEKKIDKDMDKMFGEDDSSLKTITKLAKLKEFYGDDTELNHKIDEIIIKTRKSQAIEKTCVYNELKCTLNENGDVVCIIEDNGEKY